MYSCSSTNIPRVHFDEIVQRNEKKMSQELINMLIKWTKMKNYPKTKMMEKKTKKKYCSISDSERKTERLAESNNNRTAHTTNITTRCEKKYFIKICVRFYCIFFRFFLAPSLFPFRFIRFCKPPNHLFLHLFSSCSMKKATQNVFLELVGFCRWFFFLRLICHFLFHSFC